MVNVWSRTVGSRIISWGEKNNKKYLHINGLSDLAKERETSLARIKPDEYAKTVIDGEFESLLKGHPVFKRMSANGMMAIGQRKPSLKDPPDDKSSLASKERMSTEAKIDPAAISGIKD